MQAVEVVKTVEIPEDVEVTVENKRITVKGKKGTLTRDFSVTPIEIELEDGKVKIYAKWPRKREAALVGTISAHIQNMITGVTKGFTYKLKIVFSHFPISVKVQGDKILIENFTGEKTPRVAKLVGTAEVKVKGDDILVQGINIEDVGQTAANIEQATKIKKKDPRIFLDGIYIYERKERMED